MSKSSKITASELVLSAIFFLQQKNGVTARDITKFISERRGCKQSHLRSEVKKALEKATENGVFTKKRGLYRIESGSGKNKISVRVKSTPRPRRMRKLKTPKVEPDSLLKEGFYSAPMFSGSTAFPSFAGGSCNGQCTMMLGSLPGDSRSSVKRISIDRLRAQGLDDDDDDDFYEEEEDDDDDDVDFFTDEQQTPEVIESERDSEPKPEKKKSNLTKRKAQSRSKSRNTKCSKAKKRKLSKSQGKRKSKRKRAQKKGRKADKRDTPELQSPCRDNIKTETMEDEYGEEDDDNDANRNADQYTAEEDIPGDDQSATLEPDYEGNDQIDDSEEDYQNDGNGEGNGSDENEEQNYQTRESLGGDSSKGNLKLAVALPTMHQNSKSQVQNCMCSSSPPGLDQEIHQGEKSQRNRSSSLFRSFKKKNEAKSSPMERRQTKARI